MATKMRFEKLANSSVLLYIALATSVGFFLIMLAMASYACF